jgi:UDP-glucuronate 4-epimerase
MKRILITGSAGFIGFHLCKKLMKENQVIGIDNLNDYYDVRLKKLRNSILKKESNYIFYKKNIDNLNSLKDIFKKHKPNVVINLAAQAGVRHSLVNPSSYINTNIKGFYNILECSRIFKIKHLVYASSSSVYKESKTSLKEKNPTEPNSLYGVTKKTNELMGAYYSKQFKMKITGLRFFSVYGPYGRPDMAYFDFSKKIIERKTIHLFNNGQNLRDMTSVFDIVEIIKRLILKKKLHNHEILNIGNQEPVKTDKMLKILFKLLKKKTKIKNEKKNNVEVFKTYSDSKKIVKITNFNLYTNFEKGLEGFTNWFVRWNQNNEK